jgi:hypothetical protein
LRLYSPALHINTDAHNNVNTDSFPNSIIVAIDRTDRQRPAETSQPRSTQIDIDRLEHDARETYRTLQADDRHNVRGPTW